MILLKNSCNPASLVLVVLPYAHAELPLSHFILVLTLRTLRALRTMLPHSHFVALLSLHCRN